MQSNTMRILVVGQLSPHTSNILSRLLQKGSGFYEAKNLADALEALRTFQFDVVLAAENLCDGRGYDLAARVAEQSGSLLVAVQLSGTSLWLPVLERGMNVLGERALNVRTLEWDLEELLSSKSRDHARAVTQHKVLLKAGSPEFRLAERLESTGTQGGSAGSETGKWWHHEAK